MVMPGAQSRKASAKRAPFGYSSPVQVVINDESTHHDGLSRACSELWKGNPRQLVAGIAWQTTGSRAFRNFSKDLRPCARFLSNFVQPDGAFDSFTLSEEQAAPSSAVLVGKPELQKVGRNSRERLYQGTSASLQAFASRRIRLMSAPPCLDWQPVRP